ncbi:MAG: S41 family peptidase [Candidatus Peribacteraceae bacterium]|nr:S41 family peptidase [Candidatus Peribacteraceae bacterium]
MKQYGITLRKSLAIVLLLHLLSCLILSRAYVEIKLESFGFSKLKNMKNIHLNLRRASTLLLIIFCASFIQVDVSFAQSASVQIHSQNSEFVSRSDFLRGVVYAFGLEEEKVNESNLNKYARIPQGLRKYASIAQKRDALSIFGDSLNLSRGISRHQAIFIMVKMGDINPVDPSQKFEDVTESTLLEGLVGIALEKQWLKSESNNVFGVNTYITGAEAKRILRSLEREFNPQSERNIEEKNKAKKSTYKIKVLPKKTSTSSSLPDSAILQSLWRLIEEQYLYDEKIDDKNVAYSMAEAMMKALDDPYSIFMRPASSKNFQTQINGKVTGIGAQVEYKDGVLTIVAPLRGSPAEKAGLLPGDEIHKADGVSLVDIGFMEAVEHVRGPENTSVKLTIRRNGVDFEKKVERATVQVPEIEIKWQGDVAIVKILQFGQATDTSLRAEMIKIQDKNPSGIVIDLRNNPGGLLHAANIVVGNFVPMGSTVAQVKAKNSTRKQKTDHNPTIDDDISLVVLINGGSASASEIVAGALQDYDRATIIGEKSFGKGTVQQIIQFNDDSSMKMTIAEWLTPKGRKIDGKGVIPDIKVEDGERDPQMRKALEILR